MSPALFCQQLTSPDQSYFVVQLLLLAYKPIKIIVLRSQTIYVPPAYRCPDYKRRLYYGLMTLRHFSRSGGILIRYLRMRK